MPSRFVSLAILVYWCVAAFFLLTWEVLPELSLGYPPDFRAIASAGDGNRPVSGPSRSSTTPKQPIPGGRWARPSPRRGEHRTAGSSFPAGWLRRRRLIRTAIRHRGERSLEIGSTYRVDPSGNLRSFDMKVPREIRSSSVSGDGRLKGGTMEVVSKGPMPHAQQDISLSL